MTSKDKLIKAKINLLVTEPWFGQLACYLNLIEKKVEVVPTAAINERGDFFFSSRFINKLTDLEIKGLVCHEILHLAFQHTFRLQNRNPILWNIAADLKVNNEIRNRRDIMLPSGGLIPTGPNDSWKFADIEIQDIDQKTSEQIYNELYKKTPKFEIKWSVGKGKKADTSKLPKLWKKLIDQMVKDLLESSDDKKDKISPKEFSRLSQEWKERINVANQTMQGNIPLGLKRELDALENPELSWYQIIRQRFTSLIKKRSWKSVNKKWLPYYFPGTIKTRNLKAVVAIDTSGSMSKKEITKAISEVWGIASSFRSFKLYIVFNDTETWNLIEVNNGNREKIRHLEPKGGGGTDFKPVFNLVKNKFSNLIDCLIFFTDGYGSFPDEKPMYQTYWITSSEGVKWPFGQVVKLKGE